MKSSLATIFCAAFSLCAALQNAGGTPSLESASGGMANWKKGGRQVGKRVSLESSIRKKLKSQIDQLGYIGEKDRLEIAGRMASIPGYAALFAQHGRGPSSEAEALSVLAELHDAIKSVYEVEGEGSADLRPVVLQNKPANCIGSAQLLLVSARALGIDAEPVEVLKTPDGLPAYHVASLVSLPGERYAIVDLLMKSVRVTPPFKMEDTYEPKGGFMQVRPGITGPFHKKIRPLTLKSLQSYVYEAMASEAGYKDNNELAQRLHKKALAMDPEGVQVLLNGLEKYHSNTPAEKEAALRRILEVNPDSFDAHRTLAGFLRDSGRYVESIQEYEVSVGLLLKEHPNLACADPRPGAVIRDVPTYEFQQYVGDLYGAEFHVYEKMGKTREQEAARERIKCYYPSLYNDYFTPKS